VYHNKEQINACFTISFHVENISYHFCYDCTDFIDNFFCKEEIKRYKKWCKDKELPIDKDTIKKIKSNTLNI
jgi:hypothetical protein